MAGWMSHHAGATAKGLILAIDRVSNLKVMYLDASEKGTTIAYRSAAMPREDNGRTSDRSSFYGRHYTRIDNELAAEIRREVFGDDIGQESWRTGAEQTELAEHLNLTPESRVLDVAC